MSEISPKLKERLDELFQIARVIPREYTALEIELAARKWPAYRFLGPMEATRLFREAHENAYKGQHKVNADRDEAEKLKIGHKTPFHKNNDRLTQIWKARQFADSLGVPYPDYLEFCMDFASQRSRRRYLPQPNQLGPKGRSMKAWWDKFHEFWNHERKKIALNRMPAMIQYNERFRRGLPSQTEFVRDLLEIGAEVTSGGISAFVERYVVRLAYLTLSDCRELGAEQISSAHGQALEGVEQGWVELETYPPLKQHDLLQSCFGMPGAEKVNSMLCDHCYLRASCDRIQVATLRRVKKATGEVDPVAAKKRAAQRERTRRSRARKALREAS